MDVHPYGWLCLLPPLVAIALAIVTRRAVLSLLLGVFVGALVTTQWNPVVAVGDFFEIHLWPNLIDPGKMRVYAFTLLMGAMVGVISRSGGMQGLIQKLSPLAKTRRGGQLTTWALGWVIFFDDYANTILLGSTLRPLCDRLRISRQKLAYLVDSTAAPIASCALLSTWIAVEVEYIGEGLGQVAGGESVNAMGLFVSSIPYRFYVFGALLLVPILAIMGREFGPMLTAERDAAKGLPSAARVDLNSESDEVEQLAPEDARWFNAVIPILVTLGIVIWLIYATGKTSLGDGVHSLQDIVGAGDSPLALQYGSLAGLLTAMLLCKVQRIVDSAGIVKAASGGARVVLPAIMILWCAAAISKQTGKKPYSDSAVAVASDKYPHRDHRLYTADYLADMFLPEKGSTKTNSLTVSLLPTAVFILAAILSFATGTSFGTMGILVPMVISLSYPLLANTEGVTDPTHPILLATLASVLAGAVFGDHCSPISDTTILSSQASGCDHIAHVVTQMPYAITAGAVAILLGTIPIGFGMPVWLLIPIQIAALIALVRTFAKPVEEIETSSS